MLLDRLLEHIDVHVDYFSLCLLTVGWRLRLPGPPDVMLHFVLRGRGTLRGPSGRAWPLAQGSLAIVPKGTVHVLESGSNAKRERRVNALPAGAKAPARLVAGSPDQANLVVACGLIRVRYGRSLRVFDQLRDVLAVDMSDCLQVQAAVEGIVAEQTKPDSGGEALMSALMTECLVHPFRHMARAEDPQLPWLAALGDARLACAVKSALDAPATRHTVGSLAKIASMSRSAFARRFSEAFGQPPMNLVRLVRLQLAAELLTRNGTLSIDAVAGRIGYSSRSHFSRAFKEHFNSSPSAFRAASVGHGL